MEFLEYASSKWREPKVWVFIVENTKGKKIYKMVNNKMQLDSIVLKSHWIVALDEIAYSTLIDKKSRSQMFYACILSKL